MGCNVAVAEDGESEFEDSEMGRGYISQHFIGYGNEPTFRQKDLLVKSQ